MHDRMSKDARAFICLHLESSKHTVQIDRAPVRIDVVLVSGSKVVEEGRTTRNSPTVTTQVSEFRLDGRRSFLNLKFGVGEGLPVIRPERSTSPLIGCNLRLTASELK